MNQPSPQSGPDANPQVDLETSLGCIRLELFQKEAPITVANFLSYVNEGYYAGTLFHRVIPTFMIQGGGLTPGMKDKEGNPPIKNEAANGLSNRRGTVAMARTQVVDSATSQFFINVADNDFLDHKSATPSGFGYCVFGRVAEGMEVVDRIKEVSTRSVGYHDDVPVEDVLILEAKRVAQ